MHKQPNHIVIILKRLSQNMNCRNNVYEYTIAQARTHIHARESEAVAAAVPWRNRFKAEIKTHATIMTNNYSKQPTLSPINVLIILG